MPKSKVYIIDNGGYSIKVGWSNDKQPRIVPNCIMKARSERRRPFIGNQIKDCRDISGLFYILCFQRGYLINWDVQKTIWDYVFSDECVPVNLSDHRILITEPQLNFLSIRETMMEIFFEEYDCDALCITTAADLSAYQYNATVSPVCCLVIDIGYSFTHIVPFIKGEKFSTGIRRIDIGGKVLTNHFKELISYRQLNVMDESYVINQVKEDVCFVSQNFKSDMHIAKAKDDSNTIVKDYVLPDFATIRRGYMQDVLVTTENSDQQTLRLNNERFSIPEALFHPSDIGIHQMGIPECVVESINTCPEEARPFLYKSILICGGCSQFPGMKSRIQQDIRSLAPDDMEVSVAIAKNPTTSAWEGGVQFSAESSFDKMCVTRQQFEEVGVRMFD